MGCSFLKCASVSPEKVDETDPNSNLHRSNVINQAKQSQIHNSLVDQMNSDTMRESLLHLDIARFSSYGDVKSSNTPQLSISTPQTTSVASINATHTRRSAVVTYNRDRIATSGNFQASQIFKGMPRLDQTSDINKLVLSSYDNTTSYETELQFSTTRDILSQETISDTSENFNHPHSSKISTFTPNQISSMDSKEINRFETSSIQSYESYPIFNSICSSTVSYSRGPSTDLDSDTETYVSNKTN